MSMNGSEYSLVVKAFKTLRASHGDPAYLAEHGDILVKATSNFGLDDITDDILGVTHVSVGLMFNDGFDNKGSRKVDSDGNPIHEDWVYQYDIKDDNVRQKTAEFYPSTVKNECHYITPSRYRVVLYRLVYWLYNSDWQDGSKLNGKQREQLFKLEDEVGYHSHQCFLAYDKVRKQIKKNREN